MKRTKRIALAVLGLLGLATPVAAGMLNAPAWLALATAFTMFIGAIALASALPYSRWSKKPGVEKPKEDKRKEIPLTTANLEALMDGRTELAKEDKEAIGIIIREGHALMEHVRQCHPKAEPPPKKEMRKRILGYIKTPVSVPTPMGDQAAIPITIFDRSGKNDPEKIKEELADLETAFGPPYPSKTFPHTRGPRQAARDLFGKRARTEHPAQLANRFRDLASRTPDEEARRVLLQLAEEASGLLDNSKEAE